MINNNLDWNKLLLYIEKIKPNFGTISLELLYHQNNLSKVKITQKQDVIIFDKIEEAICRNNDKNINN
jgi:hypothetical protein